MRLMSRICEYRMLRNLHQSLCRTLVEGQRIIRPDHGDESAMVQSVFGSEEQLPGLDDSRECLLPRGGDLLGPVVDWVAI
jgi:hypothetical protein